MKLQLLIVDVAKCSHVVSEFFHHICHIMNLVGTSCKRKNMLQQIHHELTRNI